MTDIVITNYNRCEHLCTLLDWLLGVAKGVGKITIIDNGSTWRPTLALYADLDRNGDATIIRRGNNDGYLAARDFVKKFPGRFLATDPDVFPAKGCPSDLIPLLHSLLDDYPQISKAGPGLLTDSIPRDHILRRRITKCEAHVIFGLLPCMRARAAYLDTTFALYRNSSAWGKIKHAARTEPPYSFQHPDWYVDLENPSPEYRHYFRAANKDSSTIAWLRTQGIRL